MQSFINTSIDPEKSLRLLIKMTINKKVTQISPTSSLLKKTISDLLSFAQQECCTAAALNYFLLSLASKLIEHGESLVALHPASAFSLSFVAVSIGRQYPLFMDLLMGMFYRRSIYTVPKYPVDASCVEVNCGQKDGESIEAYSERMCGIVYLFGAVLGTHFVDGRLVEYAWVWIASLLNMPASMHTASVLCSFIEVTAYTMWKQYGKQFLKILEYVRGDAFMSKLPIDSVAANSRLRMVVDRMVCEREFEKVPEGYVFI